jgi:hypothetical protein
MGKPATPTREQIAKLIDASKLAPPVRHPINDPIRLEPQGLALVLIK